MIRELTVDEIETVIFDFDGTVTEVEKEGKPYHEGYLEDLAILTGMAIERVRELAAQFEKQVAVNPNKYGWIYNGNIVAPATVDPYLRMAPVARMILAESGMQLPSEFVDRLCSGILYKYNYKKTLTCFRPNARTTFNLVGERRHTYIVTNSAPDDVQKKVRELAADKGRPPAGLDWLVGRVYGSAKKYVVIDGSVPNVGHSIELLGLNRPVLLQRPHYYKVLEEIRAKHDTTWSKMAVVGDIFELDLALPYALGCAIVLMANEHTLQYERDFVTESPCGLVVTSLLEVAPLFGN